MEARRSLALGICVACGATAAAGPGLQATLRDLNQGLQREGLALQEEGWLELVLRDEGWSQAQEVEAGTCLTAVVVSDAPGVVFVELDGHRGHESDGASWLEDCVDDTRAVDVRVIGPAHTSVAFALFLGPTGGGQVVRSYFGPESESTALVRVAEASDASRANASTGEPGVEPSPLCSDDEAREHYRRGMRLARAESFDEAADALSLAYGCQADGTILFNLASVTARQGRVDEAREMYLQLLRDHPNIPESLRREVDSALESLRRPGTLIVRMRRGDELFINGVGIDRPRQTRTSRRLRVRVLPGTHTLVLRGTGARHEVQVHTAAGSEVEVDPRRSESR